MRVLQIHNAHREPGGEDTVVEAERQLLASHDHVVEQFLVHNPTSAIGAAAALARSPWNRAAARGALQAARRFRPDVVHVHNTWYALSPAIFAALHRSGYTVVATLHNFRSVCANSLLLRNGESCELCVGSHPGHAIVHRCYRDSALQSVPAALTVGVARRLGVWSRYVDGFLVLDDGGVAPLVAGGVPEDRIEVRPNFVTDPGTRGSPPSDSQEVLYAGRLSHEKGVGVLLDAWARAALPRLRLSIVGDGDQRAQLQRQSSGNVTFQGRLGRAEVIEAMRGARCLVFPSICREAGPLAPIEAVACGTPVVMSESVGMAHRLTEAGAGWSVPPGDPGRLATTLGTLSDAPTVDRAGTAARALYHRAYGSASSIASLLEAYQRASYRRSTSR